MTFLTDGNSKMWMPTYALIAANVIVYAFTAFLSGDMLKMSYSVLATYGQYNLAVLQGEVWRLFSAMFVHADIVHLFGNMFFLLIFGLKAEEMFSGEEYLLIYFLSGLVGGLLTLGLWPPDSLSIGASGAVFGMLGGTIIYPRRVTGQSIISALVYAFFLLFLSSGQNVNYLAHLGGLAVGLLVGYALALSRKPKQTVTYQYGYSYSR